MTSPPPEPVRRLVEGVLGTVDDWAAAGEARWRVRAGGRRAFVKAALDAAALEGLRNECSVIFSVASPHLPRAYGAHVDADEVGVLVLEDLDADGPVWPPPWPEDIEELVAQLRSLHAQPVPERLSPYGDLGRRGWAIVAAGAPPGHGLLAEAWLRRALPALLDAESRVRLAGDDLVHGALDERHVAWAPGRGLVAVGWADAGAGNGEWDVAALALAVRRTTAGERRLPVREAGAWAAHLAASAVLAADRERAGAALDWACEELGLPPPDGG